MGPSLSEPVNGSGSGWKVKRLDPAAAHPLAGPILGVVGRIPKIRHGPVADLGGGNEVEFIGAERFIAVDQTVYAVVFKIQIAGYGVKGNAGSIAQALGDASQMGNHHVRDIVRKCEHID